ncbi:type IV secretion system DNA-binding domain-containing protein [Acidithiobacillus ferriphilus]|uniref:type IV secretion system DNA-binding domain-containing protein n=2 Tax=Acidithiobacillus ferriphilus TaxID=1689834 RepID=UPI001C07191B|nr:type IV secretion system DNA-binding domain-containing protein [Acidithiobacillus ferriphilus]MBU2844478.1 type IV secretion system DNA-binding domain-containing protein [Acidithiobacillus ferriphilus]
MSKSITTGPNDPRFSAGSGFLQIVGLGAVGGLVTGYSAIWEAISLYKTDHLLTPASLLQIIHTAGVMPPSYAAPLAMGAAAGVLAGAALGWKLGDIPGEIHIRGSQLTRSPKRLQKAVLQASPPVAGKNEGVRIHPRIQTTEHLETSHTLIVGGAGAGKTTILWPMIDQIISRGDRAIIFSFKGDFEQRIGSGEKIGRQFALLAPWDSRSALWAVGRDIQTRLDAEALANTLIPEPAGGSKSDPMWTNGSRSLLVGIISDVQREHGAAWGFAELAKRSAEALADFPVLKKIIERESPQAYSLISGGASSKTTASFLATISSFLTQVINLGVAADNLKKSAAGKQWSVNSWLSDASPTPRVAVLGFRPSAKAISQAWGSSIIEQIVLKLSDLPDVSPDQRRIWLILDEAPKLGQVPSITDALETLRSKGVRVILGTQGIDQIEETYSKNIARSWATQTAIKIIGRIGEPESQKWASSLIGERELERFSSQYNVQSGGQGGSTNGGSYQRVKENIVMPGELGSVVTVTKRGPRAILHVAGSNQVGLLDWPFVSQAVARAGRDAHQAPWVLPRYQRPDWGTTPPKVAAPPAVQGVPASIKTDQQDQKAAPLDSVQPDNQQHNDTDASADGAGAVVADQVVDHVLDAMIPGAGMLHTMLSAMDTGGGSAVAPAVIRRPQQQQDECDTTGSDVTHENEPENE